MKSNLFVFTIRWLVLALSLSYVTSVCHPRDFGHGSTVCVCSETQKCTGGDLAGANLNPAKGSISAFRTSKSGDRFTSVARHFSKTETAGAHYNLKVALNPSVPHQKILGFGGAFTDTTGYNLLRMPNDLRTQIMSDYFAPGGIHYRMARIPIGSTDFSLRAYSLDDTPNDETLSKFALAKEDLEYKIPFMKEAQSLSKNEMKFFCVAWGAPGWMKTNGVLNHGGYLKGDSHGKYYKLYAEYLVKFLSEYKKQGINFWGINVVNEPSMGKDPNYGFNSLGFDSHQQADFVKLHFGPELHSKGFENVNLMIHDDNVHLMHEAVNTIYADQEASKYSQGVAFHWYANGERNQIGALDELTKKFPSKFFLATEACTLKPLELGNWTRAESYWNDIMNDLNHGAHGWVEWNMVLDHKGGPSYIHANYDDTLMINAEAKEYYKQPTFYTIGHFSAFVLPDSHRVQSDLHYDANKVDYNIQASAFVRPDGHRVVVLANRNAHSVRIELHDPTNGYVDVELKEHAIETLIYS